MFTYSSHNLRNGYKVIFNKEPYIVDSNELVKPGKGQAFSRVKLRNLLNHKLIEKTFKSTDCLEVAHITDIILLYLYQDFSNCVFMNHTFDHIFIDKKKIGKKIKWLIEQDKYLITFWNNKPIEIHLKQFVILKVIDTGPGIKGDSIGRINKIAKLSTGALVKVPLFIQIGNLIKVNTSSGLYVSRI